MEIQIKMPDLATAADEVRIVRWLIEPGQPVKLGQPLVEIETDKATMDVECVAAGTLKAIHANQDEMVAVGQVIAIIESAAHDSQSAAPVQVEPPLPQAVFAVPKSEVSKSSGPEKSLFARNKSARQSGPQAAMTEISLSGIEREVARRLQTSKQTIPHFYLKTSANAEPMISLRMAAKQQTESNNIVWDAFFVVAIARALKEFPRMGFQFEEARLVATANAIGVAADIDNTLYVVAVENPLSQTIHQISQQILDKVDRIRQGNAEAKKLIATAITVTNLGAENIESFAAIINPGEAAILAVGQVAPTVVPVDGEIVVQQRVQLTLSVDHRIANGKYAAKFLSRVVAELEAL